MYIVIKWIVVWKKILLFVCCSKVDNNEDYDDMAVVGADMEERYFDGEDPDTFLSDTDTWWRGSRHTPLRHGHLTPILHRQLHSINAVISDMCLVFPKMVKNCFHNWKLSFFPANKGGKDANEMLFSPNEDL